MTVVLAAPVRPQGIKFRRENHSRGKYRKKLYGCQAVFLIFPFVYSPLPNLWGNAGAMLNIFAWLAGFSILPVDENLFG
jgi:hypothetical protein